MRQRCSPRSRWPRRGRQHEPRTRLRFAKCYRNISLPSNGSTRRIRRTLFTSDSQVFENGGIEGSYANYLAKHLGPELGHFKSFKFSDYKVDVRFEGPVALTTETYNYRIETQKGEIVERRGVATSVLKKVGRQWKILSTHGSSRKPKGS